MRDAFDSQYRGERSVTAAEHKSEYRAVSCVLASCVLGVIIMRVLVYFLPLPSSTYGDELISSAAFALPTQLLFFLVLPFCVYKFFGKRTVKQTLEYGSYGRFAPFYLLAIPLGIAVYIVTIGVSSTWSGLLRATGYNYSSSTPNMPSEFNAGFFAADVLLTAVLPAVCEEFAMRGGLLTAMQRSFKKGTCIFICAVVFGLFHQNVRQVFYTALFGALAAYMTIELKSIYPAMLMHFTNNFLSVFTDYASTYGWSVGGGFFELLSALPIWALAVVFLLVALLGTAIVVLMLYCRDRRAVKSKLKAIEATADAAERRAALFDIMYPEPESAQASALYKPKARDIAVVVSMGAIAVCTTVFTYVWGFFY